MDYTKQIYRIGTNWSSTPIVQAALIIGLGLVEIAHTIMLTSDNVPLDINRKMWEKYREERGK